MTVFDHVAYPLKVRKQRAQLREKVHSTLELVGMAPYSSRYPSELSGGQQQRVALARAVVYEPEVLLLDEPLSNLDATLREHMRQELQRLHRRLQLTTVLVTHDQLEALSLSDHVILMNEGRIAEAGPPQEIYERPRTLTTAKFVGSSNQLLGTVIAPGPACIRIRLDCGPEVHAKNDRGTALEPGDRVIAAIKPEDVEISSESRTVSAAGTVESIAYFGSFSDLVLRLPNDDALRVRTAKSSGLGIGSHVDVSFPIERLAVFPPSAQRGDTSAA